MKKQLLALSLIIVVLAVGASSTLAYFTTRYTADNIVSVGGVSVALVETTLDEDGVTEIDYPSEPVEVMPATTVSKIVRAVNDGDENDGAIWVRAKVDVAFTDEKLPVEIPVEGTAEDESPREYYVTINYNTEQSDAGYWTLKEDGYYYYSTPLNPEDESEPLFTEVKFSPLMGNEYMNSILDVKIYCSAVQSANNPDNKLPYPPDELVVPDDFYAPDAP